jgi:hypothetical protein
VKVSEGDIPEDTGRVQLYCDNGECAVREMTVVVERNGVRAGKRADVRALNAVDGVYATGEEHEGPMGLRLLRLRPDAGPEALARRQHEGPLDELLS